MSEYCKNCIKRLSGDDPGCLVCVDGSGKKVLSVAELFTAMSELKTDLEAAVKREYPVGAKVVYTHGQNTRTARVIDHSIWADRLKVIGNGGTEFWVGVHRCIGGVIYANAAIHALEKVNSK